MEESQSSAQTAIEMYKKMGNEESLVSILINFIDFWNKKKDLQQAFFYAKLAEAIVEKKKLFFLWIALSKTRATL